MQSNKTLKQLLYDNKDSKNVKDKLLPLHCRPWRKRPLRSFLQCWQTVGRVYEWMTNVCGTLTLESRILSNSIGRPI